MASLRVFLSSTALDLAEYRRVADDTLLRLPQQQSVVMERFGARPGTPVAECERLAAEADCVVCIVAHRYGYEPEPGRGSITRREVEAARGAGKPVYAWIVDDKHPWTEVKEQDRLTQPDVLADPAKAQEVWAAVKALQEFKTWLRKELVADTFTTPDDLGRKIATTLASVVATGAAASAAAASGRPSAPRAPKPELRIVHALQPAPHFSGRAVLVDQISKWVDDTASPDRLHAMVAVGGTGKTAIAEQVVAQLQQRWPPPGAGNVLVWSFYEKPDADAFVRECAQLFLGEPEDTPAGGRLERLQRGLRDGRPHLIVLDGLERVQAEAGISRVRGELEDHTLKLLLQAIAAGLGRTRALVTSRFPLIDLRDWLHRGFVETHLEDLESEAARQVLRGWGVVGSDAQLNAVCEQVGRHALSVAVIGSYLSHFAAGGIEAAAALKLDEAATDDPKAAKLARVLAFYAERLPADERELLARLSVFPRGITVELLGTLVDAGGQVAGVLINAKPALARLLQRLVDRGLVFRYAATDGTLNWTAHPFVRERFAGLLGCPAEAVFDAVAKRVGQGLELRPEKKPKEVAMLDRYEQLIEATRLAGRVQEAFDLYWFGLGGYTHLCKKLGDYARGYRILRGFLPTTGDAKGFGQGLTERWQSLGLNALALMARGLGRLYEAADLRREDDIRKRRLGDPKETSIGLQNTCEIAHSLGCLGEELAVAHEALEEAGRAEDDTERRDSLANRANTQHHLGDLAAARADFAAATALENEPMLYSSNGRWHARHHLDLGQLETLRAIAEAGTRIAQRYEVNHEIPGWHALFARLALAQAQDAGPVIAEIRVWTARTGDMEWIIEAHDLAARAALARGDLSDALAEVDDGLRQARLCGYRLKLIELLITKSAIDLARPDPRLALAAAREALDLATAPECRYAWGEADAAHAWGLAFEALSEREHAQRAFRQALAVRERIEHPQAEATRAALKRVS
jgi:tetratricopeptide (TPR) repeat protein